MSGSIEIKQKKRYNFSEKQDLYVQIKQLASKGLSAKQIGDVLKVSNTTCYNYAKFFNDDELKCKLKSNGIIRRNTSNYKDGQRALYERLREECKQGKHRCEICGSSKHIEIHHKEKLQYDDNYCYWKTPNFNNEKDNIQFLCNSCHQKLHYRKLSPLF